MSLQVSGSKFYYLKNEAVLLEMGLVNWALAEVSKRGFTPLITPEIVRSSVVGKCGFQPRGQNTQVCNLSLVHNYEYASLRLVIFFYALLITYNVLPIKFLKLMLSKCIMLWCMTR